VKSTLVIIIINKTVAKATKHTQPKKLNTKRTYKQQKKNNRVTF